MTHPTSGRDIEDGLRRRSPAALSSVLPGAFASRSLQFTFVVPPILTQMSHDGSPTQSSISQTQGSSPSESTFLAGVTRACESVVEEYRRSRISKAQASRQILATLSSNPDSGSSDAQPISEDERRLAYDDYFGQLEAVDDERRAVGELGGRQPEPEDVEPQPSGDRSESPISGGRARTPGLKRARTDEEESDDRPAVAKRPINPTLFAFGQGGGDSLDAELRLTLDLKSNYVRDVKFVKAEIASQPDLPDVPPSVWDDIIRNTYVDFDKIITSHFSLEGDPHEVKHLGDFEVIAAGGSRPKRSIMSQPDWALAWDKYKQGVLYLYPHRGRKLAVYERYILGLFTAAGPDVVLNFDKAVRSRSCSPHQELDQWLQHLKRQLEELEEGRMRFASLGTGTIDVDGRIANSSTFAPSAVTPSATATETAAPLLSVPQDFVRDAVAQQTIQQHPDLFRIVMLINVDHFEWMLRDHPNLEFVQSVVQGLHVGFWPCAEGPSTPYPNTWDESHDNFTPEGLAFVKQQCAEEERLERFSAPFKDLLPGMYSMPIHAVPKLHMNSFCMVIDHSAGSYSLNSLIDRDAIGIWLDNVQDLACNLLAAHSQAYRRLPIHPLWQIKQVVTVDGERRVDRCNNFGDRVSGFIWCSFFGLVLWIAINICKILELLAYVDDMFGHDAESRLVHYKPYDAFYPAKQKKQEFGHSLMIIGFHINAQVMTIALEDSVQVKLVAAIRDFLRDAPKCCRKLVEWLRLLGYANWGLNIAPLLWPALQSSWDKTQGKTISHTGITINKDVMHDLLWFASMFERSSCIYVMKAQDWDVEQADLLVYNDASSFGLGFWCPLHWEGFLSPLTLPPAGVETIFWYEALTVLSALVFAAELKRPPKRLVIFTDNLNTVQIFDSLSAHGVYTKILLFAIQVLIQHSIDLRVLHIAGQDNVVVDALSRGLISTALQYAPDLCIFPFLPPRNALGATGPWTYKRLVHERTITLGSDLGKATQASYDSHLQSYLTFCKLHAFPITPTEDTLSFFIVYMSHHIQPDFVAAYLSGICNRLQLFFPHVRDIRAAPLISCTLTGCLKLYRTPPNRKHPLSVEDLATAVAHFPNPTFDDMLFLAILYCGFFTLHRLRELVLPDQVALRDWRKTIKRSSVQVYNSAVGYLLPYHKGDRFYQGSTVVIASNLESDPHYGCTNAALLQHAPGSSADYTTSSPLPMPGTPSDPEGRHSSLLPDGLTNTFRLWAAGARRHSKSTSERMLSSCKRSCMGVLLLSATLQGYLSDIDRFRHLQPTPPSYT
ncbi:hypothetical protein EW146_g5779 [Bondarzewia mesenterica]|uniref:Reverse transcriptase domain-containing protein n=1 Tax=Bondarzewia mesenterica TaxID=1095465 RepID=A0A4S4LS99_9AGAM|nr:hypothetical protein EW146_g5779 [Bondarzewia mesenterica]